MSKHEQVSYRCERCDKKLQHDHSHLDIVTSISEHGHWSRLHVQILHRHGVDNRVTVEPADICKDCALGLLGDAIKRIKRGERASAGTEDIEQNGWTYR